MLETMNPNKMLNRELIATGCRWPSSPGRFPRCQTLAVAVPVGISGDDPGDVAPHGTTRTLAMRCSRGKAGRLAAQSGQGALRTLVMFLDEFFETLDANTIVPGKTDYSYDIIR